MSPPAISAFISYAKADQAKAQEIADSLEQRGFKCWIAPRDVRPGRTYGDEIIRGIERARALILVLSSASNKSGFVSREIERAVSKNKHIFTVRLEDVLPSPGLELFISSTQWIDAYSGRLGPHIDRLAALLAEDEAADAPETATAPAAALPPSRSGLRRSPWVLGAGAAALLAVIAMLAVLLVPKGDKADVTAETSPSLQAGFFGPDTRRALADFKGEEKEKLPAGYAHVGVLAKGQTPLCNATLVGESLILTSNYCLAEADPRKLTFQVQGPDGKLLESNLTEAVTSAPIRGVSGDQRITVAKLAAPLGKEVGWVETVGGDPAVGHKLDIVAVDISHGVADRSGVRVAGASTGDPNCVVLAREAGTDTFSHRCVSPMGSGGAPIFDATTGSLLGIVGETDTRNWIAVAYRADGASALIREAAPAPAPAAGALSGTWTGSGHQTGGGAEPSSYQVVMRIPASGGSTDYPSLGCGGSLIAVSTVGDEAQFREHITYGECIDGGTIDVKLNGGKLAWKWSGVDDIVVTAELESAGR